MLQHGATRKSLAVALVLLCSACALLPDLVLRERDHPLAGKIWDPASATFIAVQLNPHAKVRPARVHHSERGICSWLVGFIALG